MEPKNQDSGFLHRKELVSVERLSIGLWSNRMESKIVSKNAAFFSVFLSLLCRSNLH